MEQNESDMKENYSGCQILKHFFVHVNKKLLFKNFEHSEHLCINVVSSSIKIWLNLYIKIKIKYENIRMLGKLYGRRCSGIAEKVFE